MNFTALLLFVCALFPVTVRAAGDDLQTLYFLAKAKDPTVGRALAQLDGNKADVDISIAQMLPRIDANAGVNWIESTTVNYAPTAITGSFTGDNYGIGIRLPLFHLPTVYGLALSRASVRAADASLNGSQQELIVKVADAYFGLIKAQTDESFYRNEKKRYGLLLEQALALQNSGAGDIMAVFDAKTRLESASVELIRAEGMLKLAIKQLSTLVGRQVTEVKDPVTLHPSAPSPANLQWWLDTLQKQHPSLIRASEMVNQSDLNIKSVKAGHLPVLQASAGYTVSKGSTFLPQVETRQWYAGFNVSLPIFSGGETTARTRKAVAAEIEQNHIFNATSEQLVQKLNQSFLDVELSNSIASSLVQKKAVMEQQYEAIKTGYDMGTRTAADLLNAEQGLAYATRDLSKATYDNTFQRLSLKFAAGILEESDLITLNSK
jgi:outer membrane protein